MEHGVILETLREIVFLETGMRCENQNLASTTVIVWGVSCCYWRCFSLSHHWNYAVHIQHNKFSKTCLDWSMRFCVLTCIFDARDRACWLVLRIMVAMRWSMLVIRVIMAIVELNRSFMDVDLKQRRARCRKGIDLIVDLSKQPCSGQLGRRREGFQQENMNWCED